MGVRRFLARALALLMLAAGLVPVVGSGGAIAEPPSRPPNIVLITTDDQSVADLKHMPFTRKLIGRAGTRFTDAISPYPLCCPARATLLTGQHAHNHGVLSNRGPKGGWPALRDSEHDLLPVWLRRAGYRTTFTGKFLNVYGRENPREVPAGWDNWHAIVKGVYRYGGASVNENGLVVNRRGEYQADITQRVTENAIKRGARTGEPFFIWQSNLAPHAACNRRVKGRCDWSPPVPMKRDKGDFARLRFHAERSPSFNERVVVEKPRRIREIGRLGRKGVAAARTANRKRVESLQAVDRNVRDTVRLLREKGELSNTLLVFASDNGYALGQNRWNGKTVGYEPVLRVPLLMRGPRVPKGRTVGQTVSLVDVASTFARVAGAEPTRELDGISLLDVARGREHGYRAITIEAGPSLPGVPTDQYLYRGVRTKRYTYMRHPVTGEVELYDRRRDPHQLVNVAYRPTHARTRAVLERKLAKLSTCEGAACHAVNGRVPAPRRRQGPVHPDELAASVGSRQLVTFTAARPGAKRGTAVAWERHGRQWRVVRGPMPIHIGGRGLARSRQPSGNAAPSGVHDLAFAFGSNQNPGATVDYRRLRGKERWPSDPRSRETYNVLQRQRPLTATWRPRHEKVFARYPGRFRTALVLDYNRPRRDYWSPLLRQSMAQVPADVKRGSLLLHTGRPLRDKPWITLRPRDLAAVLGWARPKKHDTRFVVGTPGFLRRKL